MPTSAVVGGQPSWAVLDAARDYVRIALSRMFAPEHESLFDGDRAARMDHVAPHLFAADPEGRVALLAVSGLPPGEAGLLVDAPVSFAELRRHLRRFLTVVRQRDGKQVLFRYYDPRVLRVFLPVCTPDELRQFFGPLTAIHCQTEDPGHVLTYTLAGGRLRTDTATIPEFFHRRYGLPADNVGRLMAVLTAPRPATG